MKELALVSQEREKKDCTKHSSLQTQKLFLEKAVFHFTWEKINNPLILQQRLFTSNFRRLLREG